VQSADDVSDGRRVRSIRSRQLIVDALLDLIGSGNMMPTTNEIAEKSGVSQRTVFRHIDDMETLYRDMSDRIEAQVRPAFLRPLEADDWRGKLDEVVGQRAEIYEYIMPLKVAAGIQRFRSPFLMEDYKRFLIFERTQIKSILPKDILRDSALFAALELALSFQTWRRLRQDQGLKPAASKRTMRLMLTALLTDAG